MLCQVVLCTWWAAQTQSVGVPLRWVQSSSLGRRACWNKTLTAPARRTSGLRCLFAFFHTGAGSLPAECAGLLAGGRLWSTWWHPRQVDFDRIRVVDEDVTWGHGPDVAVQAEVRRPGIGHLKSGREDGPRRVFSRGFPWPWRRSRCRIGEPWQSHDMSWTCHLEVRPGIQFVASLGRPTTAWHL